MTNITLAIPEDLYNVMQKHKEVSWNEIARQAMWERAMKLELMDTILSNSKLSEKDTLEIGRKVNTGIAKKHGLAK